ncbi:MAG: EsaB/YukD family protein [Solirubrobacteraceae bacterium]
MPETERTIATDIPTAAARNLFVDRDATADQGGVGAPGGGGSVDHVVGPTPDGETAGAAEDSAAVGPSRVEVTFRHASGSARLLVPRDVPVGELLPEFLELAGVNERGDEWTLASGDGEELRYESTLGECGARDGSVLVLKRRGVAPSTPVPVPLRTSRDSGSCGPKPRQARSARAKRLTNGNGGALSERTARTLPAKLTAIERVREALRALQGNESSVVTTPPATAGVRAPGAFALPARVSLRVRVRDAWAYTEDRRRLERMIVSPRLLRCVTIAVVSPKGEWGRPLPRRCWARCWGSCVATGLSRWIRTPTGARWVAGSPRATWCSSTICSPGRSESPVPARSSSTPSSAAAPTGSWSLRRRPTPSGPQDSTRTPTARCSSCSPRSWER